jgi:hypothetical protein
LASGQLSRRMFDLIYVGAMIGFFLVMLAFVRGLEILGTDATGIDGDHA